MTIDRAGTAIRPLERHHLSAALEIQALAYPAALLEHERAFASRITLAGSCCLAATRDGVLIAYLLAHAWPSRAPPSIGNVLADPVVGEVLFIHDLAVSLTGRGTGVGRQLVLRAFDLAARDGLERAELIAVEGAAGYWQRLGFTSPEVPAESAGKVAAYGAAARWMERDIERRN
ncbi:Acetyltransferase (GNAT) family protein [Sphingomonas jeddahensis]|uniref:Acetyltransferase (GNAT) family protein n=2 Tax=Sphingomonas jeddahensis TaxID=1915074 RepID=A0A1V2EXU5_9SPHN|nr:Acetyltransferase (GNAT) family protein [Sphingomonas jeddahensis]